MSSNKSSNDVEQSVLSPLSAEDGESPRKRMRLDNSAKKSWSLMDRKTDQDVLQEMGISILDTDEGDSGDSGGSLGVRKPPKRKHSADSENVNPNIIGSPRAKLHRSPKKSPKRSLVDPGPSKAGSEHKSKPLQQIQPTENILETTFLEEYLIEQETPLAQSISAQLYGCGFGTGQGQRKRNATPLGLQEELILSRRPKSEPQGTDSFAVLSDEIVLSIFRWLPKRSLANCMLICKRWHRVACDETLWQRLDLGNKSLNPGAMGRILSRKPVIVRLANSEIGEWHPTSPFEPSRIQYLDLSMVATDIGTLNHLLSRCQLLRKLSLESVALDDTTCLHIGNCSNLETLNLTMAQGITAEGLTSILRGCSNITALNISWCDLSLDAIQVLVSQSPIRLLRLNMGGARVATNEMIETLVNRCPNLVELDLSDCSLLEEQSVLSVHQLTRLEHLALSRCYQLPPKCLTKLSCMPSLQYLEVWGMLQTASLSALKAALPAIQINRFMFSAIARPTVGTRRTSIWGLRTRD